MHDDIKRFHLEGEIADANIVEGKARMVGFLESQMRDSGFVPALDLEPQFTLDYDRETETMNFILSVYGIYVGREQACSPVEQVAGIMAGKMIMRSTPRAR